jgi:hypothetical protein
MLIITVVLFVLMVTSIALHSSGDEETLQSIQGAISNYYYMLSSGGILYGC